MVLSETLQAAGVHVSTVWAEGEVGRSHGLGRWADEVGRRCEEDGAEVILLHYSVFAFSRHGVPAGLPLLASRLRRLGLPVVLFAHEVAYPWGRRGWRGWVHAATQRAALIPLFAASAAVVVTTEGRVGWLNSRWFLPRRPVTFAPVFSNIRTPASCDADIPVRGRVGVFSFGGEGLAVELVTGAVADVARDIPGVHLALIGAPGPEAVAGEQWRQSALASDCPLIFTGVADEAAVSRELAACAVLVHPDPDGPSSRKTSLAASLAHGKAVVALDGPHTWGDLVAAGAVTVVVEHDRRALAHKLYTLLLDPTELAAAGSRAKVFYENRQAPTTAADAVQMAITAATSASIAGRSRPAPWLDAGVIRRARADCPGAAPTDPEPVVSLLVAGPSGSRGSAGEAVVTETRVTLVAHDIHDNGGMERAFAELIRQTHAQVRYTVVAATLAPDLEPLVDRWIRVRAPARPFPLKFLAFFIGAGLAIRRDRAQLVHTIGAIVPNRVDIATIQFCHAGFRAATGHLAPTNTSWTRRVNTTLGRGLGLAAERWTYRPGQVRVLAAVSKGAAKEVATHYPGLFVCLTPNGIDVGRFHPDESDRERVRSDEGIKPETCVALFVGGEWERKGLGLAVEGVAEARAAGADIKLWVVGVGDEGRIRRLARRLGVEEAVTFFGPRKDVEQFYRAADVFVLPSEYETFGIVCFEAAACGLPLVIPPLSGAGELVGQDDAGMVISRDGSSIASALGMLAGNPAKRIILGHEAQLRGSLCTWRSSTASVAGLYRSLATGENST